MSGRPVPARAPGAPERQLADHRRALDDLQRDPMLNSRTIEVNLANGVATKVRHGLGRPFTNYYLSAPRGAVAAGYVAESAGDDGAEVVLTANGFGATVTYRMTVY